jgi:hypothetical protein
MEKKKRNYPLFIIDRTMTDNYPNEYVVCLDKEVGFIAKAFAVNDNNAFNLIEDSFDIFKFRGQNSNIVLKIEDYLYDCNLTNEQKQRVKTLLKKGFKKLMHIIENIFDTEDDLSIKNQIALLRETQQHNKNNYLKMVEKNGKETTDYAFNLLDATIQTLEEQQEIQKIFNSNE